MGGLKEQTSLEYGLALSSVKGLGNTQIKHLITHFGGIQAVFDAEAPDIAQLPSSYPALVSQILALTENLPKFRDHLDTLRNENIRGLCLADLVYPRPTQSDT